MVESQYLGNKSKSDYGELIVEINIVVIVRYAAKIPAFREMATVLYNVRSKIPEGYWDLEKNSSAAWRISEARVWEKEHDKVIQGCMRKAENILQMM